jgi:hypothetical protein
LPKVPARLPDSVFFLFADVNGAPKGTGFIVSRHSKNFFGSNAEHYYAVTNYHVAKESGGSNIRLNTGDLSSRFLQFDPNDWIHQMAGDDLAVIDITDQLEDQQSFWAIGEYLFFDQFRLKQSEVTLGENAFMVGLLVDRAGERQNVPHARFGNLAGLASEDQPVEQPTGLLKPSHLVDMRSRTGFSGSPVFIYRTHFDHLDRVASGHGGVHFSEEPLLDTFLGLLGVHCGQIPEEIPARDLTGQTRLTLAMPSSVTIVVPAWRITELLNHPALEEQRIAREQRWAHDQSRVKLSDK